MTMEIAAAGVARPHLTPALSAPEGGEGVPAAMMPFFPLRPRGRRGRGPSRSDGRVRWGLGTLQSERNPQPWN